MQSEEWLEDYGLISVKCICLSLKEACSKNLQLTLTSELLGSFLELGTRRNSNINKYIFEIVALSINRSVIVQSRETLLEILFECVSEKRTAKKLKESQISAKEEMWLCLVDKDYFCRKIQESSSQEQYHRLVVLLGILKQRQMIETLELCSQLQGKDNLNSVYRIQLEQLAKD